MMNKGFLFLLVTVLAGISFAAGGYTFSTLGWLRIPPAMPRERPPAKANGENDLERPTVVALGRLEPEGGIVNVGASVPDRLEKLFVKEGEEVKLGDQLAQLESHAERQADRDLAASQLAEARNRLKALTEAGQAVVREAEIQAELIEKVEPLDILAQEARVRLLDEQLANAKTEQSRLQGLKPGSVPQQQLELQALAARKAEEELAGGRALLDKLKHGHQTHLEAAQAKVATAQTNLARSRAEIPLDSLKNTLDLAETRLAHTIIRAPTPGKILKVIAHPGETLGARPILQMGDTKHMLAIAEVYETDVQHVKKGQKATITSRALAEPRAGTVVSIGSVVAKNRNLDLDPTAAADNRVVEVKIRLAPAKTATDFINLQVKVAIKTE